ncbi:cell surface protein SprA [Melioribacteraceae bacterium 4301-Me]|uniref:T9SS outer membrane translocon Sov/SprA n=1 Tax=Pyranulibacter aquaticus TaxID=3163344 RepID=UPI00359AD835
MGIKIVLFPFFIFILVLSFGFTRQSTITNHNTTLFNASYNYWSKLNELRNSNENSLSVLKNLDSILLASNSKLTNNIQQGTNYLPLFPDTTKSDTTKKAIADSLLNKAIRDSLRRIDSLSTDSTARLKYFHYQREDEPYIEFNPKKPSSFFVYPSQSLFQRTVALDSTGNNVVITEKIAGEEIKPKLTIPLSQYIEMRMKAINRNLWQDIGYKYELKSSKQDLSQLITNITNIEIPLPSTSFLSIFGPPKISLRINGAVDIHGAWRNETTSGITTSLLGNTRNEPDFKQQVQINLSGTIGDKLNLSADWNTERQFQYENQLKIKYTGYEDEIVQSVEAGNVSLQTSPLVGGSEALFGVKALFKMGPFTLTALASQKKSEVQEVSVTGGAKSQTFELHAYNYSQNHFFIHELYTDPNLNVFNKYYNNAVPIRIDSIYVKNIEVWKTATGYTSGTKRAGNAFINLPRRKGGQLYSKEWRDSTQLTIPGIQEINRRWELLQPGVDYDIHPYTGFISFKTQIQDQDAIAVAFQMQGPTSSNSDDVYFGEFLNDVGTDSTARIVLLLVKPPNLQPQFKKAWKLQLKNIYPIGGRDIKQEGFKLDIQYRKEGQEPQSDYNGVKLIQAFGLDKTDASGTGGPDGNFDFNSNTIIPSTGEIIFPVLEPFGKDFPSNLPDSLRYQSVYDTTVTYARQDVSKDKFLITGEYSASVSSTFNIGFNVVENSVKVFLGGNQLHEGTDYSVDYNVGQIIIRKPEALVPGADLKITYEQNDLFQLASKTLLGFRGIYQFNKETSLGFSFLNLNQQTLSDKVRIGEEPLNNSIFGVDFQTSINLPFLTKALDNIFSTSTMSNLSLKGEWAYMNPDPNTKKSTIASDGGQSIAYIDDFEGAKKIIPIGLNYTNWHDISVPTDLQIIGNLPEKQQINYKAKTYWFNHTPSDVTIKAIYGNRKQAATPEQSQIPALDLVFLPTVKGYYNWTPDLSDKTKNWGGMMTLLSSTANNLTDENIDFIEFWMKVSQAPQGAKLNIDLGQISEDVIPNGVLDTEDKNNNGLLDVGEDTGIDGLVDQDEPGYDPVNNPDPSGDNFKFQLSGQNTDYSQVNGTEGNGNSSDQGRIPDTEDLNGNFTLDRVNSFFRYEIPIDTNRATNPFIQGGGDNDHWYLIRIPLKDYVKKVGNPTLSVVETMRFWIQGADSPIHIRLAEMNLVGNQWQKVLNPPKVTAEDTVLTISTVNIEDNPEYYSPPGVVRELDRAQSTQANQNIYKNEQSLDLIIKNLEDGDKREVVRYLYKQLDVFNYKQMKLFIHTDDNDSPGSVSYFKDITDYGADVYIRFGSDSLNYYEYKQPLRPNLAERNWSEVDILFSELTAIKQARDSAQITKEYIVPVPGKEGHFYGVRGNPTLTRISYFTIGIMNPPNIGPIGQKVSGSIWINELRVLGANDTPGWAYSASASFKMADLMSVNFNISQTNPYFHKLPDRFGSRQDSRSWGLAVNLDLLKLIPFNLPGSNLQVSYQRNEQTTNPLYIPGTDISVVESQNQIQRQLEAKGTDPAEIKAAIDNIKAISQSVSVSETWSLSNVKIKIPTDLWYVRDTFNNLSFGFNYNKSYGRTPTIFKNEKWIWNASMNYSVNLSRDLYFEPARIPLIGDILSIFSDYKNLKIYFAPSSLNFSVTASRREEFSASRTLISKPNIQRDFTTTRSAGFSWTLTEGGLLNLGLNYNFDISSSLAYLLTKDNVDRPESDIWYDIFHGAFFGEDYSFKQSFDLKANPRLPSLFDLNRYITLSAGYTVSYAWQNDFRQENLGRSAGYSSRLNANLSIRLKSIFAPLFRENTSENMQTNRTQHTTGRREGRRGVPRPTGQGKDVDKNISPEKKLEDDSNKNQLEEDTTSTQSSGGFSLLQPLEYLKLGIKWLLLDYDQISINFSNQSGLSGSGIAGTGTGFKNFWGFTQSTYNGPSRLFMLGLSNNIGARAPNGSLQDNFTYKNQIDIKTSRPLWEGAQLDISWNVSWGINKITSLSTDSLGNITINNLTSTGTIDRSFLSFPPFLFFNNGIKKVDELYDRRAANLNQSLSDAFVEGFESFSILSKVSFLSKFLKYLPRPNWNFSWSGLEKFPFLSFANRVSIQHAYTSTYSEGWKINPDGIKEVQSQKVDYGFSPLLGVTFQFNKILGGVINGSFRFTIKNSYSLGVSTRNITESLSKDINFTASYNKSGFELPIFGISLKNDIEISLSYTSGRNSSVLYEMDNFKENGIPQDGTVRTIIQPQIKYVMSSRVTMTIFYKRTTVEPEGASRIPPTTTNEAGVDLHIAIQ